ncbi:hypothetical protein [Kutzneria sp. NPDC052558]|uniref:hypothetical protein n=1 Tax=Kutzneria sp. NPDC052558 TaxID=3364121 RepID=UPI0037CAF4C7
MELEHKITLRSTTPLDTVWDLATTVDHHLTAGQIPGFTHRFRDPFQTWDFLNHLFQVTKPESERGYISFIPTTTTTGNDRYMVKRKHFSRDAPARREQIIPDVHIRGRLETYIARTLGDVVARCLPTFRRVRYDNNVESLRTGNTFGVMFDRCHLIDRPSIALVQCEVEYVGTRSLAPPQPQAIHAELGTLTAWIADLTAPHHDSAAPAHYSKLAWLTRQT